MRIKGGHKRFREVSDKTEEESECSGSKAAKFIENCFMFIKARRR